MTVVPLFVSLASLLVSFLAWRHTVTWTPLPYLTLVISPTNRIKDIRMPDDDPLPKPSIILRLVNESDATVMDARIVSHHCWARIFDIDDKGVVEWVDRPDSHDWARGLYVAIYPLGMLGGDLAEDAGIYVHWWEPSARHPKCRCKYYQLDALTHDPSDEDRRQGGYRLFSREDRRRHREYHDHTEQKLIDYDPRTMTPPFVYVPFDPLGERQAKLS